MTLVGDFRHFRCDACQAPAQLDTSRHDALLPDGWCSVIIDEGDITSRLSKIHHLCRDCRHALDRHFYGPQVDHAKIGELRGLIVSILHARDKDPFHFAATLDAARDYVQKEFGDGTGG